MHVQSGGRKLDATGFCLLGLIVRTRRAVIDPCGGKTSLIMV